MTSGRVKKPVKPTGRNPKRSKGKGLLSVEVPLDLLARFRAKVKGAGGCLGWEVSRMIERDLNLGRCNGGLP